MRCLIGAMTKVPWQIKGSDTGKQVFKATKLGQVVSIDQMVSTQAGFVAQLKSKLTNQRYKAATIFVDHFLGLEFVKQQNPQGKIGLQAICNQQPCRHRILSCR